MAVGEVHHQGQTRPPRRLVLSRSLLAAHAGRSRFYWAEERRSTAATEEDPEQTKAAASTETDTGRHSRLDLASDRETGMDTQDMGSVDMGNVKVTKVMAPKDRETEKETGEKDPGDPARAHSESHCCIFGQVQGPCVHLGCPKSHADH